MTLMGFDCNVGALVSDTYTTPLIPVVHICAPMVYGNVD